MKVNQIVNSLFTSNTYLISEDKFEWVWLIDIGDFRAVVNSLSSNLYVKGVFITHSHFDHIYGINELIERFPDCKVYVSEDGKKGLFSDKLNLSYYHEDPVVFLGSNISILKEGDQIELYSNVFMDIIETPGHNLGCLTFKVLDHIFTGDSYIPGYEVVTKLKGGDKLQSQTSLKKIYSHLTKPNIMLCPGHGPIYKNHIP